jgi:hypothetical protein
VGWAEKKVDWYDLANQFIRPVVDSVDKEKLWDFHRYTKREYG